MKIKRLMTEDWEEGMMGIEKYCWELGRGWRSSVDHCWGGCPGDPQCLPHHAAASVCPTPLPVAGAPGSAVYEVLMAASLAISGLCEASGSEARLSAPSHIPDPSVHKTDRRLGRLGQ